MRVLPMFAAVLLTVGCGGSQHDGQQIPTCTLTGTWSLSETRTGGNCANVAALATSAPTLVLGHTANGYNVMEVDGTGRQVSGVQCSGQVRIDACTADVTCAVSGRAQDGSIITATDSYSLSLDPSTSAITGTDSGTISASDGQSTEVCSVTYAVSGTRQ